MEDRENKVKEDEPKQSPLRRAAGPNAWIFIILIALLLVALNFGREADRHEISQDFFIAQLEAENVAEVVSVDEFEKTGTFKKEPEVPPVYKDGKYETPTEEDGKPRLLGKDFLVRLDPQISNEQRERIAQLYQLPGKDGKQAVQVWSRPRRDNSGLFFLLVGVVLPLTVLLIVWTMFRRTRDQIMGGGFLSGFTKSNAQKYEQTENPTTFDDVAGLESVKQDLQELVEFLKNPESFRRLGGRVPRGVLLNGPPGTGKTLLARAVAGEAGVPFYTVNGSEFIQMFVGVGASRVRNIFKMAKDNSPSIIFIDEMDAVGHQRGAGLGGGHDEREQTLNQILSEMDGFTQTVSVIVIAATNRPDVLDPALLRPGRFDRHVTVDRPTLKGRVEIFKVHVRDVPLATDVDLQRLGAGTVGLTGADIQNLVNEAARWATRMGKDKVYMDDFEHARDKVLMGPKREEVLLGEEKEKTAYHEAGHALLAWLTKGADRVHKVTVIPRGRALGVTQTLPEEDRMNINESELNDRMAFMLGGRAAEKLVYDQFSAGAENDLERATALARRMVTKWGMSERLGPVSYKMSDEDPFLGREMHQQRQFSEHTLQMIDEEVARVLHAAYDRSCDILQTHRAKLDKLAAGLVETEELGEKEICELIGPSVHHAKEKVGVSGAGDLAAKKSVSKAEV